MPGTTILALLGKGDGVEVGLRAFLVPVSGDARRLDLLALRYEVSGEPVSLRYSIRFADETSEVARTPRLASVATLGALKLGIPRVGIGSDPPGAPPANAGPRSIALQVDRHSKATFYVGIGAEPDLDAAVLDAIGSGSGALEAAAAARDREFLESGVRIETPIASWGRRFDRSLLAIRDATADSGAILAGGGSDGEAQDLRVGTYTAVGLDLAGHPDLAGRFYQREIVRGGGPSEAASAVQGPAILLFGIAHHAAATGDRSFLEEAWPLVDRWASAYEAAIDAQPGLVIASDAWIATTAGYSTWANGEIVVGLRAASMFAKRLGHATESVRWGGAARTLAGRILAGGFDLETRRFVPYPGFPFDDRVDSGLLNLSRHEWFVPGAGAIGVDEPRMAATVAAIERALLAVDRRLSRFDSNPRGLDAIDGDYRPTPLGTAWLAQIDLLRKWPRDAEREITAIAAEWPTQESGANSGSLTWAHGEFVATVMAFLACVRASAGGRIEIVTHLAAWPRAAARSLAVPGGRLDLEWERREEGTAIALRAHASNASDLHVRLRLVPLEGEVVSSIDVAWTRDGPTGFVDLDLGKGRAARFVASVERAASIERLSDPLRFRRPVIAIAGGSPRAVHLATNSLREVMAVHAEAPALVFNYGMAGSTGSGRDLVLVGDPRKGPRASDRLRGFVARLPQLPIGAETFVAVREADGDGSVTWLCGLDDRRTILAVQAFARRIRDASLDAVLATAEARDADRRRRLEALVEGEIREWLVCGPFSRAMPIGRAGEDAIPVAASVRPSPGDVLGEHSWTPAHTGAFGRLALADAGIRGPGVAYAHAYVRSPSARDATIFFGSTGAAAVYWNGRRVHSIDVELEWRLDRDPISVKLEEGWNRLLVEIGAPSGAAVLSARIASALGRPFADVEYRASPP